MPRAAGPFPITAKIGDNAYKVKLPAEYHISNTFNIGDLQLHQASQELRSILPQEGGVEPCASRSKHGSSNSNLHLDVPMGTLPDQEQGMMELEAFESSSKPEHHSSKRQQNASEPSSKTEHPSKSLQHASEPSSKTEHSSKSHQNTFEPPSKRTDPPSKRTDHLNKSHQNTLEPSSKITDHSSNDTDQLPNDQATLLCCLGLNHELLRGDQGEYSILVHGPNYQGPRTLLKITTEAGGISTKYPSRQQLNRLSST